MACRDYQKGQCHRPRCKFSHDGGSDRRDRDYDRDDDRRRDDDRDRRSSRDYDRRDDRRDYDRRDDRRGGYGSSSSQVCRDYQHGNCSRSSCKYSHEGGRDDRRRDDRRDDRDRDRDRDEPLPEDPLQFNPNATVFQICYDYMNKGVCRREAEGATCRFRHIKTDHPDAARYNRRADDRRSRSPERRDRRESDRRSRSPERRDRRDSDRRSRSPPSRRDRSRSPVARERSRSRSRSHSPVRRDRSSSASKDQKDAPTRDEPVSDLGAQ